MEEHHIPMKELIEGPPARTCAILLRQTSFKALEENVYFPAVHMDNGGATDRILGSHTARFGEIEQRGAALIVKGRQIYDSCVNKAWMQNITAADTRAYEQIFASLPDSWEELRAQNLAYFGIIRLRMLRNQQEVGVRASRASSRKARLPTSH